MGNRARVNAAGTWQQPGDVTKLLLFVTICTNLLRTTVKRVLPGTRNLPQQIKEIMNEIKHWWVRLKPGDRRNTSDMKTAVNTLRPLVGHTGGLALLLFGGLSGTGAGGLSMTGAFVPAFSINSL